MSNDPKFAVLVPTRNRVKSLEKLLVSLGNSSQQPHQIIVVSSSQESEAHREEELCSIFPIDYLHTKQRGQILQKMIGMKLVKPDVDFIAFLDDDVLVGEKMFEFMVNHLSSNQECVGVGARIGNSRASHLSSLLRKGVLPGALTRTAFPRSYQWSKNPCEVEWLNGVSMWREEVAKKYSHNVVDMTWAVFEDVYFSSIAKNYGTLWFLPRAVCFLQDAAEDLKDRKKMRWMLYANANYVLQFNYSIKKFVFWGLYPYLYVVWKDSRLSPIEKTKLLTLVAVDHMILSSHLLRDTDPTQHLREILSA